MANNIIDLVVDKLIPSEIIGQYVDIKKQGANYVTLCPFHDDTNPSLSISDSKKIFKCFVCDKGGNVITFVSEFEKITFQAALKKLADKAGIKHNIVDYNKPKYDKQMQLLINAQNEAKQFFQYQLNTIEGKAALNYLTNRGITSLDLEKYSIGYAPETGLANFLLAKDIDKSTLINASLINDNGKDFFRNRIIFTIHNIHNDAIGFSARALNDKTPKYINSIESRVFRKNEIFYNLHNAFDSINKTKEVYLCEGFMDVIALNKAGFPNALAIMGTALTLNHLPFLQKYQVNLVFDDDKAGVDATLKAIKILLEKRIKTKIITFSNEKDADALLHKKGVLFLKETLNKKVNAFDFVYSHLNTLYSKNDLDQIRAMVKKFGEYLQYGDKFERAHYLSKMANDFKMELSLLDAEIPSQLSYHPVPPPVQKQEVHSSKQPINYSYVLIKSLVKNPGLIKYLDFDKVFFFDATTMHIAKYIVSKKGSIEKMASLKKDWEKINKQVEDSDIIESKDQLEDVLNYIEMQWNKKVIKRYQDRIKNSKTSDEKLSYLKTLQKFQRKKGG